MRTLHAAFFLFFLLNCNEVSGDRTSSDTKVAPPKTFGDTFHVSFSGSDTGTGDEASPWLTVQHAVNQVSAGDSVVIHSGWYHEEVVFEISGSENAAVTVCAAPDEEVKIDAVEFSAGVSHIVLADLVIEGFSVWGVFLHGKNHHIELTRLTVLGGEAGIRLTYGDSGAEAEEGPVSEVTINDCLVRGSDYTAVDCTPGPCDNMLFRRLEIYGAGLQGEDSFGADGIAVERGNRILVEDCYIHDNGGDGIDLNSRDVEGRAEQIVVRRNRVARNHKNGIKLWAGGRMENNAIWGQGDSPVWIGVYPGRCEVVNNSIAYNMWDPAYSDRNYSFVIAYPGAGPSARVDLILANNIIAYNCTDALGGATGLYLGEGVNLLFEGHNLYWSQPEGEITALFLGSEREFTRDELANGAWTDATGRGAGNTLLDPGFISAWPDVDLRLRKQSPAVDAGNSKYAPADDLNGVRRPQSRACDIGAFEQLPPI
jgi:hypothetical protein